MDSSNNYDKIYTENKNFFGERSHIVTNLADYLSPPAKVLDLGVGQGSTAIPLARAGFEIVGVDNSLVAITQLKKKAEEEGLKIRAVCADMKDFETKESFDLCMSLVSLQFLESKEELQKAIAKMKQYAKRGGYNFISIPTKKQVAIAFKTLLDTKEELAEFYSGWEILVCKETLNSFSNGKEGTVARILARKL
jgi:2-polyprenyl-3-methyl-5-hydroxy-6-metoxy-1,4-benzoquinol methylase